LKFLAPQGTKTVSLHRNYRVKRAVRLKSDLLVVTRNICCIFWARRNEKKKVKVWRQKESSKKRWARMYTWGHSRREGNCIWNG